MKSTMYGWVGGVVTFLAVFAMTQAVGLALLIALAIGALVGLSVYDVLKTHKQ
jgi:hypothetical protein